MGKRRKRETPHAEGGHGPKTNEHLIDQLRSAPPEPSNIEMLEEERQSAVNHGKVRLAQDRQQHDEAEKNSERTELDRQSDRE
jgi:hypothetical protein